MDIKTRQHLSKRVSWRFKKGELKRLTICYGEGFVLTSDYAWCEIDLTKTEKNVSIWLEGTPFGYMLEGEFKIAEFETNGTYREKTNVHEATVPQSEILFLLDKLFFDYDLRLLSKDALYDHPAQNIDFFTGRTASLDDGVEKIWIELEDNDGIIDEICMDKLSLGGNIFCSIFKQCETLSRLFVY